MSWVNKRKTRRGERWDARVYTGGEKPYLYKTFKTEADAKRWGREQETRKDKGDRPTADKRTFAQYLGAWLKLKEEGAVKDRSKTLRAVGPRTMDDYRRALTEWIIEPKHKDLPRVGLKRLDAVTYHTLESLYESMRQFTTLGVIRRLNRLLGQAFVEAERKGILSRNPASLANVPQVSAPNGEGGDEDADDGDSSAKAMTPEEANQFLKAARELAEEQERSENQGLIPQRCWSALWHVLLGTGLRPGEAFALTWPDIDPEFENVNVRRNLVRVRGTSGYQLRKPKTKKARRTVPLIPHAAEELKRWRIQQKRQRLFAGPKWADHDFIFTTSLGGPLYGARRSFKCVCARAGLGVWGEEPKRVHASGPLPARQFTPAFRIYDLRHTFVSLLLMDGHPVNVVAELVGHEQASFTIAKYGHALPKQTKQAAIKLEAVLFGTG